ncbi:hypothetical protein TWF788_009348 [Orbilia oligospora]|uniref:Uncharacterized protein n=1 Tax=Orbilia oligospora TaxID=2813651 RepID=A0A7C8PQT9_ORBOL|nr:hypothetical protein TWF788_009348 [Orbilia oligospora]
MMLEHELGDALSSQIYGKSFLLSQRATGFKLGVGQVPKKSATFWFCVELINNSSAMMGPFEVFNRSFAIALAGITTTFASAAATTCIFPVIKPLLTSHILEAALEFQNTTCTTYTKKSNEMAIA